MKIAGFVKNSFVDYPNNICSVVFTFGCPLSCYYCHNKHLLDVNSFVNESVVFDYINKRKNLVDAVTISGGEPTIQPDLKDFIKKIKKTGLKVKLDTCGVNPDIVKDLIDSKLIDYLAMDLKCSLEQYKNICNVNVDISKIKQTISIIKESGLDYEFRTTLVPEIDDKNFEKMMKLISGAKNFYIQKCNCDKFDQNTVKKLAANAEKYLKLAKANIIHASLRGFD